jgi:hypothetical protein
LLVAKFEKTPFIKKLSWLVIANLCVL